MSSAHAIPTTNPNTQVQQTAALCLLINVDSDLQFYALDAYSRSVCMNYKTSLVISRGASESWRDLKQEIINKISSFIQNKKQIDIFIFGHTNSLASELQRNGILEKLKGKLHFVYNSGCGDGSAEESSLWAGAAQTFVGHPETNYGNPYTPRFLYYWFSRLSAQEAVQRTNASMKYKGYFEYGNDPYAYITGDPLLRLSY